MKNFYLAFIITIVGLSLAFIYGLYEGPGISLNLAFEALFIATVLAVLEISLSFDNAVVNASVLKGMDPVWQRRFLTWGILVAVFGMRLLFPILIVSISARVGVVEVVNMALNKPDDYAHYLEAAHIQIAAFGGMFLLLVFLTFMLDEGKDIHWIHNLEIWLSRMGHLESAEMIIALVVLLFAQSFVPEAHRIEVFVAGIFGTILYVLVHSISDLFAPSDEAEHDSGSGDVVNMVTRAGFMSFIYLELLDASFSFDGVIGAFAITKEVVIITLGLMIGAIYVRSLTIYLVRKGTLDEYIFLEHGAHYAIGALAVIMLVSMVHHVPEVITGLIGIGFILLAFISSWRFKQRQSQK